MRLRNILFLIAYAIALTLISLWMGKVSYSWFPPQASAESLLIDELFAFFVTIGTFIFLGIAGVIIYSVVFQRAAKYDYSDGPHIEGNVALEIVWTSIPILLVFWLAGYSYQVYDQIAIRGSMELNSLPIVSGQTAIVITEPSQAIEVIAKQWSWVFRYPEKDVTSTELHLPANQRVSLTLKSEDVLHGLYIPAFRVKQDIVPNKTTNFEFTPIKEGRYRLRDSQFSGTYFATMQTDVVVESPEAYQKWLFETAKRKPSPANNVAASEYVQQTEKAFKTGWPTIVPAEPPVVNYPT
ncbi:cytochrome c oxidase subunit II [cyanobacterium endosymbiont of Epithemia clementina EcSB]|uniref:cytochrome c oxidase subunit II n=1 Tax=cyanobacterium endosymbiont of Epithemia clementina EcSB TaxID=3034674 RepID=UPI0024807237|nr:cytochrome c oxidase subunit II [cyanobacterium endosymbiont of Epithemia clementina EcSB]WGT66804.1 cytochrome c oxidase subunit II [cyanobacterium endosymbiont of Epithemia clementina EcSB]